MREENFWCKKPRYSEVRVIARRVIARYDCNTLRLTRVNVVMSRYSDFRSAKLYQE